MTPYVKIPRWVYSKLAEGWITKDQFDVLCFAYGKADWTTWVVSSYSAESVCRFFGLDANFANLQRYRRAEADLRHRGIVRDDYRRGDKRPFHLWLPLIGAEPSDSLCTPLVSDSVSDSVSDFVDDENDGNQANATNYKEPSAVNVGEFVPDGVSENGYVMSAKYQSGYANVASPEKNPPTPSGGLDLPRPLPGGALAVGLRVNGSTIKAKALTPDQCDALNKIVRDFTVAWAQEYQFDPNSKHVFKLMRYFSPWEVLCAYLTLDNGNKTRNNITAVFFSETAAKIICQRRERCESCVRPWSLSTSYPRLGEVHEQWLDEVHERWCALAQRELPLLVGQEMPLRFWRDHNDCDHFYHPKLRGLLGPWKAEVARQQAERDEKVAAEQARIADEQRKRDADAYAQQQREWEAQRKRDAEESRAKVTAALTAELGAWAFDGVDTWTAPYKVKVRLDQSGSGTDVFVTDTKGKITRHPTHDMKKLAYYASSVD
jgi:hypothetical protein